MHPEPDKGPLGIFQIDPEYENYHLSENNQEILQSFMMSNGVDTNDRNEAKNLLLKRDNSAIFFLNEESYSSGMLGTVCLPPSFISKIPEVLDYEQFSQKREDAIDFQKENQTSQIYVPKDYLKSGDIQGESTERELFYLLKCYLEKSKDDVLMLFGHVFLWNHNYQEKDFLVVNLSKGYILSIETKYNAKNGKFKKALNQQLDTRMRVEKVVSSVAGILKTWKFISVYYQKEPDFAPKRTIFTIIGSSEFESKLAQIEAKMANEYQTNWNPKVHVNEFKELSKQFMYEAQGNPEAPITGAKFVRQVSEEIDKASTFQNIWFWSPQQLTIINAIEENWMVMIAYYGTGKTSILRARADHLLRNTEDIVHFYVDPKCIALYKLLREAYSGTPRLKLKYLNKLYGGTNPVRRKVKYENQSQLLRTLKEDQEFSPQDHVIVDEYFLGNRDVFIKGLAEAYNNYKSLWLAVGPIDTNLVSDEDLSHLKEDIKAIPIHCPDLNRCLRNSSAILKFSLGNEGYMDKRYETLGQGLVTSTNINPGIFKHVRLPPEKIHTALKIGLKLVPRRMKTVIIDDTHGKMPSFERKYCIRPQMVKLSKQYPNIVTKNSDQDLLNWMDVEEETEAYLVMCTEFCPGDATTLPVITSSFDYSGYEVQSMIYIYRHCPDCETGLIRTNLTTRAKSSLVAIQLRVPCLTCSDKKK